MKSERKTDRIPPTTDPVMNSMMTAIEDGDVYSSTVKVIHPSGTMFTITAKPATQSEMRAHGMRQ